MCIHGKIMAKFTFKWQKSTLGLLWTQMHDAPCTIHWTTSYISKRAFGGKKYPEQLLFLKVFQDRQCPEHTITTRAVILHGGSVIDAVSLGFCLFTSVNCQTPKVFPGSLRQVINVIFTMFLHQSILSTSVDQWSGSAVGELEAGEAALSVWGGPRPHSWIISTEGTTWAHGHGQEEPPAKARISSCVCFCCEG